MKIQLCSINRESIRILDETKISNTFLSMPFHRQFAIDRVWVCVIAHTTIVGYSSVNIFLKFMSLCERARAYKKNGIHDSKTPLEMHLYHWNTLLIRAFPMLDAYTLLLFMFLHAVESKCMTSSRRASMYVYRIILAALAQPNRHAYTRIHIGQITYTYYIYIESIS